MRGVLVGTLKMWKSLLHRMGVLESGFDRMGQGDRSMKVIKKGSARRVIFFYPGEEGTYVDNTNVTLYENGIVHLESQSEETTTHLQNCEILWSFEVEGEDRASKVRLLKPSQEVPKEGGAKISKGIHPRNPEKSTPPEKSKMKDLLESTSESISSETN